MPIIESKLALFEVEKKQVFSDAASFGESRLGSTPKTLNAVDVDASPLDRKDVVAVVDPIVFAVADVNEPVIASPTIGVNDASAVHLASDNGLQCAFFCVRDNLGVHFPIALEDAEDNGLRSSSAPSFALDAFRSEVRLVHFNGTTESGFLLTVPRDSSAKRHEVPIDRVAVASRDMRHFRRLKVEGKESDEMPELTL